MKSLRRFEIVMLAEMVLASVANASESGAHLNWWGLGGQYSEAPAMGWLILTFAIFVWALIKAIKKPLALYLETRSKDIKKAIEEGQKAKLESEQKLKIYEEKLKSLDGEIAKIKTAFSELAEAERAEKERNARETSARILKDAEDTIKANFERSKNRLAEEVVTSALAKAQTLIVKNQLAQVDGFLKQSLIADLKNNAKEVQL